MRNILPQDPSDHSNWHYFINPSRRILANLQGGHGKTLGVKESPFDLCHWARHLPMPLQVFTISSALTTIISEQHQCRFSTAAVHTPSHLPEPCPSYQFLWLGLRHRDSRRLHSLQPHGSPPHRLVFCLLRLCSGTEHSKSAGTARSHSPLRQAQTTEQGQTCGFDPLAQLPA